MYYRDEYEDGTFGEWHVERGVSAKRFNAVASLNYEGYETEGSPKANTLEKKSQDELKEIEK